MIRQDPQGRAAPVLAHRGGVKETWRGPAFLWEADMNRYAHQTPDVPIKDDPDQPDHANDWPDREPHRPDEVREPPQPRTLPIKEPTAP